jgi:hypothetical protein
MVRAPAEIPETAVLSCIPSGKTARAPAAAYTDSRHIQKNREYHAATPAAYPSLRILLAVCVQKFPNML